MYEYVANELQKVLDGTLIRLYWELKDNHDDERIANRLDTICGKVYELIKIIGEKK